MIDCTILALYYSLTEIYKRVGSYVHTTYIIRQRPVRRVFRCVLIKRLIQAFSGPRRSEMIAQNSCLRRIAKIQCRAGVGSRQINCLRDRWAARLGGKESASDYLTRTS